MVKNLIKITHLNKQKIVDMCIALLPGVGYARVTNSGIIILKRSKWSLFSKRIPVTDVILKYIPIEIGKLICKREKRDVYIAMFHDKVATVVSLVKYTEKMDLLDVVYKEFLKVYLIVEPDDRVFSFTEPIVEKLQSYGIDVDLKSTKIKTNKNKLSERVEKLKERANKINIPIINLIVRTI